jgi:prostaglandin-endoperoxide synthase 2
MRRSTARDGFSNRVELFVLTHFQWLWKLAQAIPPLERLVNKILINRAVYKARVRPHPLSLRADYSNWDSLTDRTFSGRHLPPADQKYVDSLPPISDVLKLFERPGGQTMFSPKSTMLFSHFAQWFTDGFLRTHPIPDNPQDIKQRFRNTSNHDIDLSPLYGRTEAVRQALRAHDGTGRLKSQLIDGREFPPFYFEQQGETLVVRPEFAAVDRELGLLSLERLLLKSDPARMRTRFAMGVERANNQIGYVMFNVLFLREHNRLCRLLKVKHPDWDDERLYQTARNSVIVMLLRIVIEEYINHITPFHFQLRAQPDSFYRERWYRTNWMTLEFNLLYRWHELVPDVLRIGDREVPLQETLFNNQLLIDRGIGPSIDDATRQKAGKIGLHNTPHYLIDQAEKPSLELGRAARLMPYNAYRRYVGIPPATQFDQITGDRSIQDHLKAVYGHVDRIEYFVGLFAEDLRPRSALPPVIGRMVAIDAFSQALTSPLLSEHVYRRETFAEGWEEISNTRCVGDVVRRNTPGEGQGFLVSMTQVPEST